MIKLDVIKLAAAALEPISNRGIKVKQGWYDEELKQTHITLWNVSDTEEGHSDEEAIEEGCILQVNIWADYDALDLKKEVKKLMKAAGFYYQDGNDEQEKADLFNKAMRFYYTAEMEEKTWEKQ